MPAAIRPQRSERARRPSMRPPVPLNPSARRPSEGRYRACGELVQQSAGRMRPLPADSHGGTWRTAVEHPRWRSSNYTAVVPRPYYGGHRRVGVLSAMGDACLRCWSSMVRMSAGRRSRSSRSAPASTRPGSPTCRVVSRGLEAEPDRHHVRRRRGPHRLHQQLHRLLRRAPLRRSSRARTSPRPRWCSPPSATSGPPSSGCCPALRPACSRGRRLGCSPRSSPSA